MINFVLFKYRIKEIIRNPIVITSSFIMLLLILIGVFLFHINYGNDGRLEIKLLGVTFESLNRVFYNFVDMIWFFVEMTLIFLFILHYAVVFSELFKSSITKILVTKSERKQIVFSIYLAEVFVVFTLLFILGASITMIILFKSGGFWTVIPLIQTFLLFLYLISFFSFLNLFSLIINNSFVMILIGLFTYFFLIPGLKFLALNHGEFFQYLLYIFPPVLMLKKESAMIVDKNIWWVIIATFAYVAIYVEVFLYFVSKKEFN